MKFITSLLLIISTSLFAGQVLSEPQSPYANAVEGSHLLYLPIPPDISKEEVLHADEPLKSRLRNLVKERLALEIALPEEAVGIDRIVIFIDHTGLPILPDSEAAKSRLEPAITTANELTFTFNSPDYPWSTEVLASLEAALNDFYPTAKAFYGDPAFNITVNVRQDPTIRYAGRYNATLNEITLKYTYLDVLCHEMIHAFRDDNIIRVAPYEEGMTRAAEIEVFNRLVAYTDGKENHSYTYDVYYEGLNRQVIGVRDGKFGFTIPNTFLLLRYQLSGYAWAKAFLENSNFFIDFNQELYVRTLSDPTTTLMESKLLDIATMVQPMVEGKPFLTWYEQQGVLNTNPPIGCFLYQRINQFTVDLFCRVESGFEYMQAGEVIQWAVYDHADTLLDSGNGVTSDYGWIRFYPTFPVGYVGRIKVVATTSIAGDILSDTALRSVGNESGIFGIVPKADSGIITITPSDAQTPPLALNVVNGAFSAPSLAEVRGEFLAIFEDTDQQSSLKQFTKDASNYFLPMPAIEVIFTDGFE